jgi:hypothetical protein
MSQLKIFVSSTCYDLSQIRTELRDFILELGYQPVLSEYFSFPIDPSDDTIENCIRNVGAADVFVLLLGSRYGFITNSGKSITEHEYIFAREKGIPIYVFINKQLISNLPLWKSNKSFDFTDIVESTKVFEFVEEVREKNMNWCFEFEKAQDIIQTLKVQFTYMFKKSLDLRLKFRKMGFPDFYKNLSASAINIVLNKRPNFEVLFFAQVLKDELEKHEHLKLDLEYEVLSNCNRFIRSVPELSQWLEMSFETIKYEVDAINTLLNKAALDFFGEPGTASDLRGLYYVACRIAKTYEEMVNWSLNVKSAMVDPDFLLVKNVLSKFPELALREIWEYPVRSTVAVEHALKTRAVDPGAPVDTELLLELTIDQDKVDLFNLELNRIKRSI